MINWILQHQRKSLLRSPAFGNNTAVNIIVMILLGIMLLYLLLIGFFIDTLIVNSLPDADPITVFNGFILYYFLGALVMRFYLQDVPAMELRPYLLLPVKKSKIIHYLLSKSLLTFFNLIPAFLILPFAFKQIAPAYGTTAMALWAISIYLVAFTNNFIAVYLKKQLSSKSWIPLALVLALLFISALSYFNIFSIENLSQAIFSSVTTSIVLPIVATLVLFTVYFLNFNFLKKSLQIDVMERNQGSKIYAGESLLFLSKFGKVGELMALELKLMLRNKRPKSMLIMSVIFLFYGLIFYVNKTYMEGFGMLIFVGIFVTGNLVLNYGQFSFSWESTYFDFLLTKRVDLKDYITAKYNLFAISVIMSFIITLPYAFFGWKVVLINLACAFFNIGVSGISILYFTGKKPKRIDISKPSVFNYQGVGAAQFIIALPMLGAPIIIYWLTSLIAGSWGGIAAIALIGVLATLFREFIIQAFVNRLVSNKHQVATSLRNQ